MIIGRHGATQEGRFPCVVQCSGGRTANRVVQTSGALGVHWGQRERTEEQKATGGVSCSAENFAGRKSNNKYQPRDIHRSMLQPLPRGKHGIKASVRYKTQFGGVRVWERVDGWLLGGGGIHSPAAKMGKTKSCSEAVGHDG